MADREKVTGSLENFARTSRDSYERVLDHAVAMQERNVRFAQEAIGFLAGEYRQQAEANRAVTQELLEHAEEQYEASMDLFYAPLSYYKEGPYKEGLEATR